MNGHYFNSAASVNLALAAAIHAVVLAMSIAQQLDDNDVPRVTGRFTRHGANSSVSGTRFDHTTSTSLDAAGMNNMSGVPSEVAMAVTTLDDYLLPEGTFSGTAEVNRTGDEQCEEWQHAQHTLFQIANFCYAVAFLIPHTFKLSMLLARGILTTGLFLFCIWAGLHVCAPDIFAWNLTFVLINAGHVAYLSYRHFPPRIRTEFVDLFIKVFQPLKMDKNHFKELVRDAELGFLEEGAHYAVEEVTSADERLAILLNGKLKVTCEDTHLHYILPNQFIDSPEWEACPTDSDVLFQVTITAVEPCQYICWQRRKLQHVLRNKPYLDSVIHNLIGKDITQKLYSLNEHMNPFNRSRQYPGGNADAYWKQHFPRSLSVDVVHTGTKGHVRSHLWRMQSRRASSANSDSLGSSPARTSRYSQLSDPGPYRSPLRIPPVIVASDATTTGSTSRTGSGSGSGSESAYTTALSPAPLMPSPVTSGTILRTPQSATFFHSPITSPTDTTAPQYFFTASSSSSSSTSLPPATSSISATAAAAAVAGSTLHVAFETPV